jgi:deoxyribodipyrimidine photo-lyase
VSIGAKISSRARYAACEPINPVRPPRSRMTTIVWFRQDLRIRDNSAFTAAAKLGPRASFVYSRRRYAGTTMAMGRRQPLVVAPQPRGASSRSRPPRPAQGDPRDLVLEVVRKVKASAVFWNRCYEPFAIARDKELKMSHQERGIEVQSFNGTLLHEPWEVAGARPRSIVRIGGRVSPCRSDHP